VIAPSARLLTGHEAPKEKRRHGQHTAIIRRNDPRSPSSHEPATAPPPPVAGHQQHPPRPLNRSRCGRRTGSTPTAEYAGP